MSSKLICCRRCYGVMTQARAAEVSALLTALVNGVAEFKEFFARKVDSVKPRGWLCLDCLLNIQRDFIYRRLFEESVKQTHK